MRNYYYVIVNKGGTPLGEFHPNDIPDVWKFSTKSFLTFSTKKEVEDFMRYIKREVKDRDNQRRWGKKYTDRYIQKMEQLKIAKVKY